jgi:hypothetical protein
LSLKSLLSSRSLLRSAEKETLLAVNREEMRVLERRLLSGEFMESVAAFMGKRAKL